MKLRKQNLRLRRRALVVFIVSGFREKYLWRSISRGFIQTSCDSVLNGALFIYDDVSPLGIEVPSEILERLAANNEPTTVLNAELLTKDLIPKLPRDVSVAILNGGGILAYMFMRRQGWEANFCGTIDVERKYIDARPVCIRSKVSAPSPDMVVDDILASGQTLVTAIEGLDEIDFACILTSANVNKGNKGYRQRVGSTISGVRRLYCSSFVNGLRFPNGSVQKPAILSLRYLLGKAMSDSGYRETYLTKKFGGADSAIAIEDLVGKIDKTPLEEMRRDPMSFLKNYGVI